MGWQPINDGALKMKKLMAFLLFGLNKNFIVDDDGGGANEGTEAVGTGNDSRIAMLNQIADQNDSGRASEYESINDDGTTEPFMVQSADGETENLADETVKDEETESTIEAMANELEEEQVQQPKIYQIKVNGRVLNLTEEQMIAHVQKVEAADQYLAEAARIRAEMIQKNQQPSQQDVAQQQIEDDLAIARAIQMGTEEEAVAALRALRQSQRNLSPDDIAKTIDERLTFSDAINKFRSEYADIASDPVLNKLAMDMDANMIASGDRRQYWDRYRDVGESIRNWARSNGQKYAPQAPQVDKNARKANAQVAPRGNSQKTQSSIVEEPEESTSDVIAKIAKARGGPQWMNSIRH